MGCSTESAAMFAEKTAIISPLLSKEGKDRENLKEIFYDSGSHPKPQLNPEFLRLYGFSLCPVTEKTRCALAAKDVPF